MKALLALSALATAWHPVFASGGYFNGLSSALNCLCFQLLQFIPILTMLLIVGAAVVYAIGMVFGAENRSRASVWASALLIGGIICALVVGVAPLILGILGPTSGVCACGNADAFAGSGIDFGNGANEGGNPSGGVQSNPNSGSPSGDAADTAEVLCGAILSSENRTYYLSQDLLLTSGGRCIRIDAKNITLDCANRSITATRIASEGSVAVYSDQPRTVVKNCRIFEFERAVVLEGAQNSLVENNTILSSLNNSSGVAASPYGKGVPISPDGARILNSTIGVRGTAIALHNSSSPEISLCNLSSEHVAILLNNSNFPMVQGNAVSSGAGGAVSLFSSSSGAVEGNSISADGRALFSYESFGNRIFANNISSTSSGAALRFEGAGSYSAGNAIYGNRISSGGAYVADLMGGNQYYSISGGRKKGNYYVGLDVSRLSDSDKDGYADGGSPYPLNAQNLEGKWIGRGEDYGIALRPIPA